MIERKEKSAYAMKFNSVGIWKSERNLFFSIEGRSMGGGARGQYHRPHSKIIWPLKENLHICHILPLCNLVLLPLMFWSYWGKVWVPFELLSRTNNATYENLIATCKISPLFENEGWKGIVISYLIRTHYD